MIKKILLVFLCLSLFLSIPGCKKKLPTSPDIPDFNPPTVGSIQVNSIPTGAQVFLDGGNTGQTTDCTLTDVSPGSHTVMLVMEGYEDEQMSVSVTAGQTATVSVTLTKPTITVIELPPDTVWITGKEVEIKWGTSGSGSSQGVASICAGLNPSINQGGRALSRFQRRAFQERRFLRNVIKERRRAEDVDSSGNLGKLSSNTSKPQGVSGEIFSSAKEGDIVHKRAEDIGNIKRKSVVERVSIPIAPRVFTDKFTQSGNIKLLGLSYVKIDLYKGGTLKQTIAEIAENDGSYTWIVDSSLEDGTDYKVRVSSTTDSGLYGESNEFTIEEEKSITVTEPTSSTAWTKGQSADITWTSNGTISSITIHLSKGGGEPILIISNTANDCSYTWSEVDTSLADGTDYKVRVSSIDDSTIYGESDEFTIEEEKSITVSSPNGGESWGLDSTQQITWTSRGNVINSLKIDLYKGGSLYDNIVDGTANDGIHDWTIADTIPEGSDYRVRITDNNNALVWDESDNDFSIILTAITVSSPNGGETWGRGMDYQITWISRGNVSNSLKIDLYKGGNLYDNIVDGTANDGLVNLSISRFYPEGSDYRIRITDNSNTSIWDESDNYFSILEESISKPSIPNGPSNGEVNENIYFSTSSSSNLEHSLEYRFNWGDGIIANWDSANQSHKWSDPGTYSIKAQARCIDHPTSYSTWSNVASIKIEYSETSIFPLHDAYCDSTKSSENFNRNTLIIYNSDFTKTYMVSLVKFDLLDIPSGATIISAYLTMRCWSVVGNSELRIARAEDTPHWIETAVNFDYMPFGTSPPPNKYYTVSQGWNAFDVLEFVQKWHSRTYFNNGFQLYTNTKEGMICFYAKEAGSVYAPYLIITYKRP